MMELQTRLRILLYLYGIEEDAFNSGNGIDQGRYLLMLRGFGAFMAFLDTVLVMEELRYSVAGNSMWGGTIALGSMSEEAQQYWNAVFGKVYEIKAWWEGVPEYLSVSLYYNDLETTKGIVIQMQAIILQEKNKNL